MANYYNLTAWKHTGFDYQNRPYNRDVLNSDYFTQSDHYIQMKGIVVKRDDTSGLSYIDVQGSVKDIRGDQVNAPNVTGSQGPGGPWYSWEEVDYVRLARTGYPGDEDFVDISSYQKDPWNAPHAGKPVYTGYYFVTGLQELARNVTRLFLDLDFWTTLGGADELEIETGYKIRGPITDAEDSSSYNESAEGIGLIHPLITIGHQSLNKQTSFDKVSVLVSTTDLADLADSSSMDSITLSGSGIVYAIPKIKKVIGTSHITLEEPDGTSRAYYIKDVGLFDPSDTNVKNGISALYSAGQLDLADSYEIPTQFVGEEYSSGGVYSTLKNAVQNIAPSVGKDIGSYPRKADYMFGSMVIYNAGSGAQGVQKFSEVEDATVKIWASLSPTGNPYARFTKIKSHPYIYDQAVSGMTWMKSAVVMQGASGSMWSQINYAFQQGEVSRSQAELQLNRNGLRAQRLTSELGYIGGAVSAGLSAGYGGAITDIRGKAKDPEYQSTFSNAPTLFGMMANPFGEMSENLAYKRSLAQADIAQAGLSAQSAQNEVALMKANAVAPFADFTPDINKALFSANEFGLYVVNTDSDDRARLKNYFRRYGYSGLYKSLTWQNIHVKTKVNFIQAEGVVLKHSHFPLRDTARCAKLLEAGMFLWDERPNQAAFESQTDAS